MVVMLEQILKWQETVKHKGFAVFLLLFCY
nr:MAG TPA: hypothetical protein [Caudoviricetes sp.]